jgi:hypothetical protein
MSSVVTIGFLDRTQVCVQTEFTPPLADDERREILIHTAFLTARAFAALPPERQQTLATILKEWVAKRFSTCPVQLVGGDPMVGLPRFASTFLAPVREYALATNGCGPGADGIEYFLPMAAAGYLRHIAESERDPAELLKPALALCIAVSIHPITVASHFKVATASLPKVDWVVERTDQGELTPGDETGRGIHIPSRLASRADGASQGLRERRWTLLLSAALAALLIVAGVQYFSTLVPTPPAQLSVPAPASPADNSTSPAASGSELGPATPAPAPNPPSVAASPDPTPAKSARPAPSESTLAYLGALRDLAENSLAQVEVMVAASGGSGLSSTHRTETLDYGIRNLRRWQGVYDTLKPPPEYEEHHRAVGRILADLTSLGRSLPAPQTERTIRLSTDRLAKIHADLEGVLGSVDDLLP